jgi:hypothetical protein
MPQLEDGVLNDTDKFPGTIAQGLQLQKVNARSVV